MFFNNNFIYHKRQFLPKIICTSIIDFFEKNPNKQKGYVYSGENDLTINDQVKDSIDLTVNFNKNKSFQKNRLRYIGIGRFNTIT